MDDSDNGCVVMFKFMGFYWRTGMVIFWPMLCLLVLLIGTDEKFRCMYVVLVMAGYWVTECVPLPITGMLPIFMFPMLSVQDTGSVCKNYFNQTNAIFLAGLFIAISIEYSGLHNRIALCTVLRVGCSPRKLNVGLTFVTMFLSMWLVNSAATAMMCPIIEAVLNELESQGIMRLYEERDPEMSPDDPDKPTKITMCYYFSVAYASTIGGIGSLVGTGTNLTFKGIYETSFPNGNKIEFVDWLLFNVPGMLLMTALSWLYLQILLMGMFRPKSEEYALVKLGNDNKDTAYSVVKKKYEELGPFNWHEIGVAIFFTICILLWFFRHPQFMPGWDETISHVKIQDSSPAVLIIFLMVAIPSSGGFLYFCSKDRKYYIPKVNGEDPIGRNFRFEYCIPARRPKKPDSGLVTWKALQNKMPWGLLFLLGGGFALADAGKKSGMSKYLGEKLVGMKTLPSLVVLALTSLLSSLATELTSNVAICNIIVPVLIEMSVAMKIHPVQMTFPAALNCSFAFLMPVGTPPNAIIADWAHIRTKHMALAGLGPKIVTWLVVFATFPTYGLVFYDMNKVPHWALHRNSTA